MALTLSTYVGPEQADNTNNMRFTVDATGITKSVKNLDLWFQANYGQEEEVAAAQNASWLGFGLQPLFHLSENGLLGLRYEYFKDKDGARVSHWLSRAEVRRRMA